MNDEKDRLIDLHGNIVSREHLVAMETKRTLPKTSTRGRVRQAFFCLVTEFLVTKSFPCKVRDGTGEVCSAKLAVCAEGRHELQFRSRSLHKSSVDKKVTEC